MTIFVSTAKVLGYTLLLWGINFLMLLLLALLTIATLHIISHISAIWNLLTFSNTEDHD